ncbi:MULTISPECIES: adenylate/guanylate cyclase domain-containing protein [unclassified Mesorhizobium]|uniref:adenylate/guanylate cyclase domain-containing protein n=1 Tax=unclassified Mesorhizobium TaxID=325217 RepID=UPI001FEFF364|nr:MULTISPECIES: adenylate/guanylate cyclase domain-containing protein [unclassified Mesorhizobium]
MSETRKLAAILCSDVVGYSRLAGVDEDRILARLRSLRSDLIDPTIAVHHGRVVKRTGDGAIVEFRSVVDAVRCAIEVQNAMVERNAGVPEDRRIVFRIGVHLGDVVEESDGDLMGDGINIAARLQGVAAPGSICLSEDAYRQVKGRLDVVVTDLGPTRLKNITEPVRAYSLEVGKPAQAKPAPATKPTDQAKSVMAKPRWLSRPIGAATVALLLLAAAGGWYIFGGRGVKPAAHLSIVVLPFANLSGDPNQDYFADGVTENLTTDLSQRVKGSFVIARATASTYKGKNVDAKEIGKELGVRYVLEGSVQRDQNRVRVNAQLIDAESGAHLWADRFEEDLVDLFKLQDEVVARVANPLRGELISAEAEKAQRVKNPDAIDFVMRGSKLIDPPYTKDRNMEVRAWSEKALKVDPDNSDALALEAWTYVVDCWFGWKSHDIDYNAKILGNTDRAIALDQNNTSAYIVKGSYLTILSHPGDALRVFDAGLAIDPNSAPLHANRALANEFARQFEQGKAHIQQAIRLSPHDPFLGNWYGILAGNELGLGQFDAAIEDSNKAIDSNFRTFYAYLNLAAGHALKGEIEEAKPPLVEARKLNPKLSIKWIKEEHPVLQFAVDALRKAGLPEE